MKILVVFTGGTIGSSLSGGVADVDSGSARQLLDMYPNAAFECAAPFSLLSENATVDTLSELCTFMLSVEYEKYDGVIVTHGSDTLGYTAAVLGVVLAWVRIPVMLTAADCVLSMEKSNGRVNFGGCVDFIREFCEGRHGNTGVFAVWRNRGEDPQVHISTRLEQADGCTDRFSSVGGECFGIMKDGRFIRNRSAVNPDISQPCALAEVFKGRRLSLCRDIVMLHPYVGMDYDCINTEGKKAVLVRLYHSGTACTQGSGTSFVRFVQRCGKSGTAVYIFPVKEREYLYKSNEMIPDGTVRSMGNIGECAAYAKLITAYSLEENERNKILSENVFYESLTYDI